MVDKLLVEVEAQLEQKGVQLHVDDAARDWIAERGYDPKMGARPMARVIQEHIKRPLAEELLFGASRRAATSLVDDGRGEARPSKRAARCRTSRGRTPRE